MCVCLLLIVIATGYFHHTSGLFAAVRFGSDELWRFGVKLAVLSPGKLHELVTLFDLVVISHHPWPGEVFGEASVGLGFKRLETAVVANCEAVSHAFVVNERDVYCNYSQVKLGRRNCWCFRAQVDSEFFMFCTLS